MISCPVPFIFGIAIAGNIWTFHRITARDVALYNEAPESFDLKETEWLKIDTEYMQGRLNAVKIAVHIASVLDFFCDNIILKPVAVPWGKMISRNGGITRLKIQKDFVEKWYVSKILYLIYKPSPSPKPNANSTHTITLTPTLTLTLTLTRDNDPDPNPKP